MYFSLLPDTKFLLVLRSYLLALYPLLAAFLDPNYIQFWSENKKEKGKSLNTYLHPDIEQQKTQNVGGHLWFSPSPHLSCTDVWLDNLGLRYVVILFSFSFFASIF